MAQFLDAVDFSRASRTVDTPASSSQPAFSRQAFPEPTETSPEPVSEDEPLHETSWVDAEVEVSVATYQAYQILYYGFIALMAIVGLDKFLHLLNTWESYASPAMAHFLHMSVGGMVVFAGVVEILAAAAVALKPRIGSWVVTVWLWLIVVNLLTIPGHYDLVVSDLALSAAAFAFTRLSAECN